jgi:hypothetical protein
MKQKTILAVLIIAVVGVSLLSGCTDKVCENDEDCNSCVGVKKTHCTCEGGMCACATIPPSCSKECGAENESPTECSVGYSFDDEKCKCVEQTLETKMEFTAGECSGSVDPWNQTQMGVNETKWLDDTTLQVTAFVSINCAETVESGEYALAGNKLTLKYDYTSCTVSGICANCICAHELAYKFTNLEKKDYEIELKGNMKTTSSVEKASVFAAYYEPETVSLTPSVPQYALPLSTSDISNYGDFSSKVSLDGESLGLLEKNGFVVMENPFSPQGEDMTEPYETLKNQEIPVFITTDSLLHLYHIQFDETLRIIEEKEFYDDIWEVSKAMIAKSEQDYNSLQGEAKEAAKKNMIFFSVGMSLLKPKQDQLCQGEEWECNEYFFEDGYPYFTEDELEKYAFEAPEVIENEVQQELDLIEAHSGFSESPTFKYNEDYSQYVPRGHYTRSEKLKNYFKAMMWYGRMSFLLKGCGNCLVSAEEARTQTKAASMIAQHLEENENALEQWNRIYSVTAFYVGYSDDLGPYEYNEAANTVFGGSFKAGDLKQEDVGKLKAKLAEYRSPKIYGGTGTGSGVCLINPPFTPEQADECLEATKGFRLMGQRFIPDSYMFQNLVFPLTGGYTGTENAFTLGPFGREFPRGLDVMSLLGSQRAGQILDETGDSNYQNYSIQHAKLKQEFDSFSQEEWQKNLYWGWLYALKPLLKNYGQGYPTFMQTRAWQDKELTTALASWAELRHDTILYAKQSYTMEANAMPPQQKRVVGYVEPVPEFYSRLLALTKMTNNGLTEMNALDKASKTRLEHLETILERLVEISEKELENQELSDEDYDFIEDFGDKLDFVIAGVEDDAKKTTIIADVHTGSNVLKALEEGVGHVKLMVVAYKVPDGRVLMGAGPVFSYYEFKHPMSDRLTDEKWREMLESEPPEEPEWISNFGV